MNASTKALIRHVLRSSPRDVIERHDLDELAAAWELCIVTPHDDPDRPEFAAFRATYRRVMNLPANVVPSTPDFEEAKS
jgi:hypothetical protein